MTDDTLIDYPVIDVPVRGGKVKKAIIREITNASQYEYETTVDALRRKDKAFAEEYALWSKSWSLPEKMALQFVTYLYPGYRVRVVLK